MKLCECKMGVLVAVKPDALQTDELRIGHVVGLAYAGGRTVAILSQIGKEFSSEEKKIIPVVQFVGNDRPTAIDYDLLDLFTAF